MPLPIAPIRHHARVSDLAPAAPDEVAKRLARLADDLEAELGDSATVVRQGRGPGLSGTTVRPRRSDALAVTWLDFGDELQTQAGHGGGRWELGRDSEEWTSSKTWPAPSLRAG